MSDTDVAELLKLPAEEKLRLLELLWESLCIGITHSASPPTVARAAHRQVLHDLLEG